MTSDKIEEIKEQYKKDYLEYDIIIFPYSKSNAIVLMAWKIEKPENSGLSIQEKEIPYEKP